MTSVTNKWAGWRVRWHANHFDSDKRKNREAALLRRLDELVPDCETVLDVGAGTGFLARAAARRLGAGRVLALDPSMEMLERLRTLAAREGLIDRIEIVPQSAAETGLSGGSVDLVMSCAVWHELDDRTAALRECARVLKPGGTILIRDFRKTLVFGMLLKMIHPGKARGPYRPREIEADLMEAGFTEIDVTVDGRLFLAEAKLPA